MERFNDTHEQERQELTEDELNFAKKRLDSMWEQGGMTNEVERMQHIGETLDTAFYIDKHKATQYLRSFIQGAEMAEKDPDGSTWKMASAIYQKSIFADPKRLGVEMMKRTKEILENSNDVMNVMNDFIIRAQGEEALVTSIMSQVIDDMFETEVVAEIRNNAESMNNPDDLEENIDLLRNRYVSMTKIGSELALHLQLQENQNEA